MSVPVLQSIILMLAVNGAALPAFAVGSSDGGGEGGSSTSSKHSNSASPATAPLYEQAQALIDEGKFDRARALLLQVVAAESDNADAWNLLGFASRKLEMYDKAARYYAKALKINPGHLGALEYQGELFVETGAIDKAKANLAQLVALCGSCEEVQDLKRFIQTGAEG